MTNSILVTGGAGFVGSFLVDKLISEGNQVKILDNLDPQVHQNGAPTHLNKKAEFIQGDITNYKQVSEAIKDCEIVFNLAAKVGVGQSMYQIKEYVNTNQMGTANLLDAMINKENNIKKMIVASSMSIYGEGSYKDPKTGEIFNNLSRSEDLLKNKEWELKNPKTKEQLIPIGTNEEKNLDYSSIYAINKKIKRK